MKIEEKVLSREQMKHLQELGVARLLEANPNTNTYAAVFLKNSQVLILKVILGKFGRSKFLL